ncbi:MAG: sulfatase-like hydrolase/transferase [Planctomycetota bacterium]|jgi:arylsulfatase A-like enzyme
MMDKQHMNRRGFLKAAVVGAGAALVPGLAGTNQRSKPNIIFIIADDLGWADIGYHGSEIQTPNLDKLAKQSVRFGRHYVMPTCTPTRVGLMTGRYPSRYGVVSPAYGKIFDNDTVTLPLALRSCGYETSISGKWHMGSPPECTPLKYGFDTSYGYFHGQIDPYTHHYKTGVRSWHRNDQYLTEQGHATDLLTDEAIRIVESKQDKPFFLYVAYSVPHFPLDEPEEWTSIYKGKIKDQSRLWYAASVTHMDAGIGRIVDAVDRRGIRENTLIVFVSDNGGQKSWHDEKQYKGRYAEKPHTVLGNNLPLRGWKGDVYEGGIRVPAMANWKGVLEPGSMLAPVHIVDWMPTFCKMAGYSPDANPFDRLRASLKWDGKDIWPVIRSRAAHGEPRTLYWRTPGAQAIRQGDWKLIVDKQQKAIGLYDVVADPYEENNMVQRHSDRVNNLKRLLAKVSADDR